MHQLTDVQPKHHPQISPPSNRYETEVPADVDPYWNYVARTALMYSIPLFLLAWCLSRKWIGLSPEFWIPLALALLILSPATRLAAGRPFAYKDFMYRDRFLVTYALLPASVWCLSMHLSAHSARAAMMFFGIMVCYDAIALRYELLCVYAIQTRAQRGAVTRAICCFSVPMWGYWTLALFVTHALGIKGVVAALVATFLIAFPVVAFWLFWKRRLAPPERFENVRNVAVVGAGWSGIYAVKWLAEAGLKTTCFESSDSVGGIWKYRPHRPGGVFESTRATSSKHFLHPSDFPMPAETSEFPNRNEILEHLERYVEHFGIRDRFHLETQVLSVEKEGELWRIVTKDRRGERQEELFDSVVVASGPHQNPSIDVSRHPLYGRFAGRLLRSADYKKGSDVRRGEIVLIVGAGESSADIVSECVQQGAIVHWATRSGQWFADRNMGPFPADHITVQGTRVFAGRFGFFEYLTRRFVTGVFVNLAWGRGGHGIPEWLPDTPYLHQFLNKSRDGVLEIYRNSVVPHRAPVRIEGNEVYFADDEDPIVADTIILATGFTQKWPFLREQPEALYKLVFHPETPTLAFVGFARPIVGSIPSLSELQARWVAKVWSGAVSLPGHTRRETDVYFDNRHHRKLIRDSSRIGTIVDQELYATDIASRFDAHVHWLKLLLFWPQAFFTVLLSPWAPFKYHLNDRNPDSRRVALANTIRELPGPRSPNYLLAAGVVVWVGIFSSVAASVLVSLPLAPALAVLAVMGLVLSFVLRLSERTGKHSSSSLGRLRDVFPL